MVSLDDIISRFSILNAQKAEIDNANSDQCYPGAKIGCCTYKDEIIMEYVRLNEMILGESESNNSDHKLEIMSDERILYISENVIYVICYHLIETGQTDALLGVLVRNEDFFSLLPQAKAGKILKNILERLSQEVKDLDVLYKIFSIYRIWCDMKKRKFLGLRLELRIIIILILRRQFTSALNRLAALQNEVRLLEDKPLLLDIYLIYAKVYLLLKNLTKMKIFVGNAKNVATNINTPVHVTAEIDLLSGILYLCEKDYKTAYSYLYESFEGFHMSLCNSYGYLYPNLNRVHKKSKLFADLATETAVAPLSSRNDLILNDKPRYSCHPTTSDISAVFFTFYNLHDYYRSPKYGEMKISDNCGEHYLKYCSVMNDITSDELDFDDLNNTFIEPKDNTIDVTTLVSADERKLVQSLKYLMLATVLNDQAHELNSLLSTKNKLKYIDRTEIVMVQKISERYRDSRLVDFDDLLNKYRNVILSDPVLQQEIEGLYDTLLERNITRLLRPYSSIQCEFIAQKLQLPQDKVEKKLAEMILDNKLKGTIDQGTSTLEVYDDEEVQPLYADVAKAIGHMTNVIETLYQKAQCSI